MLVRVCAAKKNKTKAEMDAAQVLFHGQRMEKQELGNFLPTWWEGLDFKDREEWG